jgi:HAD superfamily hydrolase (TIGR01459 family)
MRYLPGLAPIADAYDGFILDLWGVIHDGLRPFPGAIDCMRRLQGRPILLLSNAPRRAGAVQHTLRGLGVPDALYTHILTSGEATWQALHERDDPWFASLGRRVLHLGPKRDRGVLEELNCTFVDRAEDADFVLNTGPDDMRDAGPLEDFIPELAACRRAGLKMICANPDLEIIRGNARILCAGALAAWYEAHGGEVRWIGKPHPAIYASALSMLGLPPSRVLAVGDSLRTDVAGAAGAGLDSVWVLGGIHAAALADDPAGAARAATAAGLRPIGIIELLCW